MERFVPLVYDELRDLAARYMRRERNDHTLSPTALVHEAYVRLIDDSRIDWQGRTRFFSLAATTMRRVLVNHARSRGREKRGGKFMRITMTGDWKDGGMQQPVDLLAFDECLQRLAEAHERQAKVVELRFFGALKTKEIAGVLDVSERTIKEDWRVARAWLLCELRDAAG